MKTLILAMRYYLCLSKLSQNYYDVQVRLGPFISWKITEHSRIGPSATTVVQEHR